MTRDNKILIIRLIISLIFWTTGIILQFGIDYSFTIEMIYLGLFIIAYLFAEFVYLFLYILGK